MPWVDWHVHDVAQAQRAGAQDDADQREAECELVADHLGAGAQRAEQRVLVVRRPAGERDAVDADGGDAEDDQQADIDDRRSGTYRRRGRLDVGAEGDYGDRDQRAGERDDRSQNIERPVDDGGHEVFLEEELQAVGQRLQQAEGTDAAWSAAVLDAANDLALEQDGVGDAGEQDHQHHDDLGDAQQHVYQQRTHSGSLSNNLNCQCFSG